MPLSQQSPTPQEVAPSPVRLDAQTQKRAITLALELQRRQQETLTADQLEAIAAEAGIEQEFIRQALLRISAEHPAARGWKGKLRRTVPPDLWPHRKAIALGLGLAVVAGGARVGFMPDLYWGLPVVAAWLGRVLGRERRAFEVGAALGAVQCVAAEVAVHALYPHLTGSLSLREFLNPMGTFGLSGVLGAAMKRLGAAMNGRVPVRSPVPAGIEDGTAGPVRAV